MNRIAKRSILVSVGVLFILAPADAQEIRDPTAAVGGYEIPAIDGKHSLAVITAGGWAPTEILPGATDGSGSLSIALRYARQLKHGDNFELRYVGAFVPMELYFGARGPLLDSTGLAAESTAYGIGLDPFGLELSLGAGRARPYVAVRGGFRWFSSDVPNPRGTSFNFSADLGIGVEIDTGSIGVVILGVDLHHISNAGRGGANPSYNIFMLRLGYSVRR